MRWIKSFAIVVTASCVASIAFGRGGDIDATFGADPDECDSVKRSPGWTYEGVGFYATRATTGQCPSAHVPIYRLYNNGWRSNNSNHRYVRDLDLAKPMLARGWVLEGLAFCGKP